MSASLEFIFLLVGYDAVVPGESTWALLPIRVLAHLLAVLLGQVS